MLMWLHVCHDVWPTRRAPSIVSLSVHHHGEKAVTLPPDAEPAPSDDIRHAGRNVEEAAQARTGFRLARKKKMIEEDRLSEQCGPSGMISRPAPQYRMGQSVLHFWASWMSGAAKLPSSISKKNRPKWYSAEILSPPTWREEGTVYGGCPAVGWSYKVF
jgi:hypothetical protein